MRALKILLMVVAVLAIALTVFLLQVNDIQRSGELRIAGLKAPVRIVRDEQGMAYIHAQDEEDLLRAQGFVAAQDRLFQMHLTRLLASGRIAELVGEKALASDIRIRTIGLSRQARKHAEVLSAESRQLLQTYLDGVNAFIQAGRDLPVEFKLSGLNPEPWTIADALTVAF